MDEEGSKVGIVARSLAADTNFDVGSMSFLDKGVNHRGDGGVALIEERS